MAANPAVQLSQAFQWIGFTSANHRNAILGEFGPSLANFIRLTEKDILSVEKQMASSTPKIIFGLAKTKYLKAMVHWAQDFDRVNAVPSLAGLDQDSFLAALRVAEERDKIRTQLISVSETRAKESSPGKLKSESQWNAWEQGLITHLGILLGVNGVPLTYVIREKEHRPGDTYHSFTEECIVKARRSGPHFEADSLQVHQIIRSLIVGENAEQWTFEFRQHRCGKRDLEALRAHFRGEGNKSRQIASAIAMSKTLHYKDERSLTFSNYIGKVKEMFNIYLECGEPKPDAEKLRFLWDTIQSPQLLPCIVSIKTDLGKDADSWDFIKVANFLASQVIPVAKGRQLSEVRVAGTDVPRDADGNIRLHGYSPQEWRSLSEAARTAIGEARNKAKKGGKRRGKGGGQQSKDFKKLTKTVKRQGKVIAALSGKKRTIADSDDGNTSSDSSAPPKDAGNAFGGRDGKQKAKDSKKAKST